LGARRAIKSIRLTQRETPPTQVDRDEKGKKRPIASHPVHPTNRDWIATSYKQALRVTCRLADQTGQLLVSHIADSTRTVQSSSSRGLKKKKKKE